MVHVGIARRRVRVVCHEPGGKAACPAARVGPGDARLAERGVTQGRSVCRIRGRFVREQVCGPDQHRIRTRRDEGRDIARTADAAAGDHGYVDRRTDHTDEIGQGCRVRFCFEVPGAAVASGQRTLDRQRGRAPGDGDLGLTDRGDSDG